MYHTYIESNGGVDSTGLEQRPVIRRCEHINEIDIYVNRLEMLCR
jgi:hypothetical protein